MNFNTNKKRNNQFGFMLAEVLITLVIIGVIAAMTVPTIMANTRKTEVETKLKQTYSLLNNALTKSVAEYGPVYTWDETSMDSILEEEEDSEVHEAHYAFFKSYIAPHLNFAKPPIKSTYKNYGYKTPIKISNSDNFDMNKTQNISTLNNGTVILTTLFGMKYLKEEWDKESGEKKPPTAAYGAISILVDINGIKSPNQVGKDVFLFDLLLATQSPRFDLHGLYGTGKIPIDQLGKYWKADRIPRSKDTILKTCKNDDSASCGALIQQNGWKIPKDYPLKI